MKKLFLIIFLMTISLGQSQTLRLGFESGESGNAFGSFGGFAIQAVEAGTGSNTSMVLPIIANAAGEPWQGTNFVLTTPVELIASKTMTIDVKSSVPVTFLMKVNTGTGPEAAAQASHNGDGTWQTISFTFNTSLDGKAATANGVYNNMVIHPFFPFPFGTGASAQTFYIDNIRGPGVTPPPSSCTNGIQDGTETGIDCGGTCSPCPPPAPAVAVANPTNASADVISVFSGAYTDVAGTNFYPNWGQNTQYAQYNAAGNATLRYSNLNYQGITFATPVDGTNMTSLHFDIWTPDCTSFQMYVLDGTNPEEQVTVTPTLSGWNSYDIPLSSYPNLTKSNLAEFKIVGNGTVYLDNIYFWKVPAGTNTYYADTDGDGFGAGAASFSTIAPPRVGFSLNNTDCAPTNAAVYPGATEVLNGIDDDCDGSIDEGLLPTIPATDAPTAPARNAWDVQSVYSSAYTNYAGVDFFPNWGQSTTFSTFTPVSNETLKYSNLTYQGIDFAGAKNISAMTKLHLDVWTPDLTSFQVVLIAGGEGIVTLTPTQSGWNSYDIDLATQYAGRNLTAAIQLKLERTLWTPTDGNVNSLYLDNIYFWRPATGTPPTLGAFTVPAKVVGAANFTLTAPTSNSTGAFTYTSSNTAVATISGSTVTIVGAGSSTITARQAAAGIYDAVSVTATLDVSLAAAAPTPTIPGDRVLSIFSGAPGYANAAGTQFYPNWGQATQFAQVDVVGNATLRYSNLNYQGIQLGSVIDISTYDTVHLDIYGAGTTAVDFRIINQVGGAGSPDVERVANRAITLNPGWNSIEFPVSALTTATPGFELNRVGQFMFVGSGTIYVDNIFFSKAVPTTVAPTVADVSFCKGLSTQLTATPSGNNPLRWFTAATGGTALLVAPTPTATTTYHVAQVMSNGVVSPRARLVATIVALPTEAVGTITSTTAGTTVGTFAAATLAVGPFVGTTTTVSYRVPAFVGANSYFWTVPAGVNIVGQAAGTRTVTQSGTNANVLNVNYSGIAAGIGSVGAITVQAQNASGCNGTAKSVSITKALPLAPAAIVMHDLSVPAPATGIRPAVRSFAKYMGTSAVLTLTATPSVAATSYEWNLPAGVNQLSGGTSNVITVNFAGVTSANTDVSVPANTNVLRIGVKAVNGVGVSTVSNSALVNPTTTSTSRLLTLTAVAPAAPTLKMFDMAASSTVAVTDISRYIGSNTTLTLVGTVAATTLASSFSWELAEGVNVVAGSVLSSSTIMVNFEDVEPGTTSLYVGIKAVNGMGASVKSNSTAVPATGSTATLLKLSAGLPSAAGVVVGSLAICSNQASSVTYTITAAAAKTNLYIITAPVGTTIAGGSGNTRTINAIAGATFTVNYPAMFVANSTTVIKTITIQSVNGFGVSSTNKILKLTNLGAVCTPPAPAPAPIVFNVVNNSSVAYIINGTDNNPTLTLTRGLTYTFNISAIGHPFFIKTTSSTGTGNAYNVGVTNNGIGSGTITFVVDANAPSQLFYNCQFHGSQSGLINIINPAGTSRLAKVAPTAQDFKVIAYPNPSTGVFNLAIESSKAASTTIQVYDMQGRMIESKQVNTNAVEIGGNYTSGIYNVILENAGQAKTIRLIKK